MKKIGMIGGLGWPSTVDYYRLLCTKTNTHFKAKGATPPYPTPQIAIESLNMNETRKLRGREGDEASWARFDTVFRETFIRLKEAGADFGMIASNTPHMRLKGITQGLDFPVISILDTTAHAVHALGGTRVLILGTPVTMRSSVYPETLQVFDIEPLPRLSDERIGELEQLIDVDLCQGQVDGAREKIITLCRESVSGVKTDVVCLACTELSLAFPEYQNQVDFRVEGITFVNTAAAHVGAVLTEALG